MFLTIALSFLFCFLFFMPLMMICGPNRTKEVEGKLYDPLSFQSCFKYVCFASLFCGRFDAGRRGTAVSRRGHVELKVVFYMLYVDF